MAPPASDEDEDPRDVDPEALFVPRLAGFPYRGVVQALACGTFVIYVCRWLGLGTTAMMVGWPVVTIAAVFAFAVRPAREAASTRLVFDEGGVRVRRGAKTWYRPFERGAKATFVDGTVTSAGRLELRGAEGKVAVVAHVHARMAKYDAEEAALRYTRRGRGMHERVPDTGVPLARGGRDLDAWCAELGAVAKRMREADYRTALPRDDVLTKVFRDRRHGEEARAAAGYFLLALGLPEAREVVRARLGPASPPLVLAMARLAPGEVVVRDDDWTGAQPYLSAADGRVLGRATGKA